VRWEGHTWIPSARENRVKFIAQQFRQRPPESDNPSRRILSAPSQTRQNLDLAWQAASALSAPSLPAGVGPLSQAIAGITAIRASTTAIAH